jgi:hypothetical protein
MNSSWLKRIATLAAAALILIFVGYQVYHANFVRQKTETALYKTAEQTITVSGYAVRKEQQVANTSGGVLQYDIADGDRVNKGGIVAHAYQSVADAGLLQKKERLTKEMKALQSLASQGSYVDANAENIDSLLGSQLLSVIMDAHDGDADISGTRQQFLSLLNEKQLSTGKVKNFSARISSLQQQLSALASSNNGAELGKITAADSGYFSSTVDGYESAFNYNEIQELSPENLKSVKPAAVAKNVVGRICSKFNWYFVCSVSAADAAKLKPDTSVKITFPFVSTKLINAEIVRINQKTKNSDAAVILECNAMDSSLINLRHETAKIIINTYQGIQISQKSVHFEKVQQTVIHDGVEVKQSRMVEGVFVMYGIEMKFKQIVPLYSDGTYLYCEPNPDPSQLYTKESIQLYDEVVIEGKGLSDGKIIE